MAMVMDQQQQPQAYKHYCRVCKKGFGCGRALGGHMRAHGINDEPAGGPDGDSASSGCSGWGDEDKQRQPPSHRRMYALRANPARLIKSCRSCENCGREFASWKSFLEHGKCSSDDGEEEEDDDDDAYHYGSFASSPRSDADDDGLIRHGGWSKGKRSRRTKSSSAVPVSICPSSEEEEDLANFLVMLSSARVDRPVIIVEPEESCASASKEDDRRHHPTPAADKSKGTTAAAPAARPRGMFECKACKKVFSSHQALGGHRASHKKVKGCFAAKLEEAPAQEDAINQDDPNQEAAAAMAMAIAIVPSDDTPPLKKKPKVHECSICQRQFSSGQALGGHKRCHWITTNSPDPTPVAKLQKVQQQDPTNNRRHHHHHHHHHHQELTLRPMFDPSETIDLNMPVAPADVLIALRQDIGGSPLRLDVPAAIYIQPWVYQDRKKKATASSNDNNYNSEGACSMNVDDEVDSKVKLAKLSELKDMNAGGEASPWLQVGIGSSGNEASTEK